MPVTWCYEVEGEKMYCAPGFPIGCYVDKQGRPKDACVINAAFNSPDTVYVFNHVDITIEYHVGSESDWGVPLTHPEEAGRLISAKLVPRRLGFEKQKGGY